MKLLGKVFFVPMVSSILAVLSGGYDLIIIDDGDVPLAGGIHPVNYYILMIAILFAIALIALMLVWLVKRSAKRARLIELWGKQSKTDCKVPFFIRDIDSEIRIAEDELAAVMI